MENHICFMNSIGWLIRYKSARWPRKLSSFVLLRARSVIIRKNIYIKTEMLAENDR